MKYNLIYEIHGIIDNSSKSKSLENRRLLDKDRFNKWISKLPKFVSVQEAINGEGNAITIDDATFAGYDAAKLLVQNGHKVTLFVNMFNVLSEKVYFFHLLNAIIENSPIIKLDCKSQIRSYHKSSLLKCTSIDETRNYLTELCSKYQLHFEDVSKNIIRSAKTIGLSECKELVELGVTLGNHLYNHLNPLNLDKIQLDVSIKKNINLINKHLRHKNNLIAPPYGKIKGANIYNHFEEYIWLLAEKEIKPGQISKNVFNRFSLDEDEELK